MQSPSLPCAILRVLHAHEMKVNPADCATRMVAINEHFLLVVCPCKWTAGRRACSSSWAAYRIRYIYDTIGCSSQVIGCLPGYGCLNRTVLSIARLCEDHFHGVVSCCTGHQPAGHLSLNHVLEIARVKQRDSPEQSLQAICNSVIGTARSMGVIVAKMAPPAPTA